MMTLRDRSLAILRIVAIGLGLVIWTWLWFLPVGGFHHMFRCGLLGWAILDGENGATEVRWSLALLVSSVVVWATPMAFFARIWLSRRARF